jgi:hypothetical protein
VTASRTHTRAHILFTMLRIQSVAICKKFPRNSRTIISYPMGYAYKISKSMMPKISDTERAALNAGTGA